jgi:NADPH:quinone reductase-like Zn-dependent oxidoreductase
MKRYQINSPTGLDALQLVDVAEPNVGSNQVLVEMKAWSLNYRDLGMPRGGYLRNDKIKTNPPLVPLSDGAGEVIAVGDSVTKFKVGDRVAGIFFQNWLSGDLRDWQIDSALGGAIDGVLAERVAFPEHGLVKIPNHLSYGEASTLPCAAVTAWQALVLGNPVPGQTILVLGTGGVSIFALQLAKLFGARVIATSSSDEKLARASLLGADATINYKRITNWHEEVKRLTDAEGVDNVIEVGGAGTLEKSMEAARVSGRVSLIGVLTGMPDQNPSPLTALFKRLTVQGIYVGSRDMFEAMNRAIESARLHPIIDKTFNFGEAPAAYEHLRSGAHFGKVVIER